jgi:glycosyltransferase involved in cell wall biosynthesis
VKAVLIQANYASFTRGGQRSISYILRDIDRSRYAPVLICQEEGDITVLARELNIPVYIFHLPHLRPGNFLTLIKTVMHLRDIIIRHQITICHNEDLLAAFLTWASKAFLRFKVSILWHVRVLDPTPVRKRLSLLFCDGIIGVSKAVADSFPRSVKVKVVYNGINAMEYDPDKVKPFNSPLFSENVPIIGYLGALNEFKGAHIVLAALKKVFEQNADAICVFVGAGDDHYIRQLISTAKETGISGRVIFLGQASPETTQSIMRRFTIFTMPSLSAEGFSRSLLEALVLERPVVGANISTTREAVVHGKTGLLYEPDNYDSCANAILTLLSDPSLANKLGKQARIDVIERFPLTNTITNIHAIYASFENICAACPVKLMKSVLIQSNYATLSRGGQKSISYILRDIDRSRFSPLLICQEEGELVELAKMLSIPVAIFKLPRLRPSHLISLLRSFNLLRNLVTQYNADICHCEDFSAFFLFIIVKYCMGKNFKVLWHVRLIERMPARKWLAVRLGDGIICVSKAVAETFPTSPKIHIIPNGIDPIEMDPAVLEPIKSPLIAEHVPLVGYLGALVDKKGAQILMAALPVVIAKNPNALCVFVGSGEASYIRRLTSFAQEHGIAKNVVFWGEAHGAETSSLLRSFTVFVMPSFSEGFSRSLLEAMSLERPTVASDIPAHKELVIPGITGLLYDTRNPDACSAAINSVLDDPAKAASLGKMGRKRAIDMYTIDKTMKKIHAIYDSI